jgi:hypothetical protein
MREYVSAGWAVAPVTTNNADAMNIALAASLATELTAVAFQIERRKRLSPSVAFFRDIIKRIVLPPFCRPLPWSGIGTTNERIDIRHRLVIFSTKDADDEWLLFGIGANFID